MNTTTFRALALSFPESQELPHFHKNSYRVKGKIFATLEKESGLACILLNEIDQSVFVDMGKNIIYPVPNKWGLKGATYFKLKHLENEMVWDALRCAYIKIAPKLFIDRIDDNLPE